MLRADVKLMHSQVYQLFRERPDLLPDTEEGLSKGEIRL